jgi:hypothetical protein
MLNRFENFKSDFNNLKTFELFDTDDLKAEYEIPYLKGEFDIGELSTISDKDNAQYFLDLLGMKYAFYYECANDKNPFSRIGVSQTNQISLVFENEKWTISTNISKDENGKFEIAFLRRGINVEPDGNNFIVLGAPSPDYNPNIILYETYKNLDINQVYVKIENSFIRTMRETGFHILIDLFNSTLDNSKN